MRNPGSFFGNPGNYQITAATGIKRLEKTYEKEL